MKGYVIDRNRVIFGPHSSVEFKHKIWKVAEFSEVLVVLLDALQAKYPDNVFGISYEGKILWQIRPVRTVLSNSPFTGCERKSDVLELHHFDGMLYRVNPLNGEILGSMFVK